MVAMRGLRKHLTVGLALLMCALIAPCGGSAPSAAPAAAGRDAQRGHGIARTEAPLTSRAKTPSVEHRDLRNMSADRADQIVVIFPRDLRKKEKFLKHITGPLYFSPKCRKHMDRLYYQTRDCTIPAYFKRCARLLTRLAGSPQCTEG